MSQPATYENTYWAVAAEDADHDFTYDGTQEDARFILDGSWWTGTTEDLGWLLDVATIRRAPAEEERKAYEPRTREEILEIVQKRIESGRWRWPPKLYNGSQTLYIDGEPRYLEFTKTSAAPYVWTQAQGLSKALFSQYILQFPKETPSDRWDRAMYEQLAREKLANLDPDRVYPKRHYSSFISQYTDRVLTEEELFDDSIRAVFGRCQTKKTPFLSDFDKATRAIMWRWHPEVFDTPGVEKLLSEGRKAKPKVYSKGERKAIPAHTDKQIDAMLDAAATSWENDAAYVEAVSYDYARMYDDFRYEGFHFLGRDLRIYATDSAGCLILNDSGRPHRHSSAKGALSCARRPGSPESPNTCHDKVRTWLVRDNETYRSLKRIRHRAELKPEDLTVNPEVAPSRKRWHRLEVVRNAAKVLGEPKIKAGTSKSGNPVWRKRITHSEAQKFYSRTFGSSKDQLEYHEALKLMAEKTGKSRGEVARIFYPFVKVKLYPDYRELRPDTDAKIRDQVVRKHRRSEYELNRIRAQLKTLASGEEWPADPHPRAVPKGTGDGPKKRKPLTHAHLAALDNPVKGRRAICRWTGPRTRDDDTPVYALPDGTAAPYVGAESIERYRQRTTGVMKAKKLPVYETDEYEDALADYEAAVERVEQLAPELDELQDRDAPANADAADAEALSLLEGEPEESETPEASVEALALADTLSAKEFEAMTFAYVHHMTNDVIAQKMGVKPETVKTWLSRGRDKVRDTTGREPERRPSGATTKKAA